MNILLKTTISFSLVLSTIQIILVIMYNITFNKAEEINNDDFKTNLDKFNYLKSILGNAIIILVVIVFMYNLIYTSFSFFVDSKMFKRNFNTNNIAVQSDSHYSNLFLELLFTILIKVFSDTIIIFFTNMSIKEIDNVQEKGGFNQINKEVVEHLKTCRNILQVILAFSICSLILFTVFYVIKIFRLGEKLTEKFLSVSNNNYVNHDINKRKIRETNIDRVDIMNNLENIERNSIINNSNSSSNEYSSYKENLFDNVDNTDKVDNLNHVEDNIDNSSSINNNNNIN